MTKDYKLEQFPKNKEINNLSTQQLVIRAKKKYEYGEEKACNCCGKDQPIAEFYIKDKATGRRANKCRDCQMKDEDVVEIGKYRFSKKIMDKGFRRCSVCKDTKPITSFYKSKHQYKGYSNICYCCQDRLHKQYMMNQRDEIGLYYIKQFAKRVHGVTELTEELIDKYRSEIFEKRNAKFFLDEKEFVTLADFARYVEEEYGIRQGTVCNRVWKGYNEKECTLTEGEARRSGNIKGAIKVTDTVTGKIFIFSNTRDEELLKMFSGKIITNSIKSGKETTGKGRSKYRNPCIIERDEDILIKESTN